jgi:hypothetical protein
MEPSKSPKTRFNELEKGEVFHFPLNPSVSYKIVFKSDSAIHFTPLSPGPIYVILSECGGSWAASVIPE